MAKLFKIWVGELNARTEIFLNGEAGYRCISSNFQNEDLNRVICFRDYNNIRKGRHLRIDICEFRVYGLNMN